MSHAVERSGKSAIRKYSVRGGISASDRRPFTPVEINIRRKDKMTVCDIRTFVYDLGEICELSGGFYHVRIGQAAAAGRKTFRDRTVPCKAVAAYGAHSVFIYVFAYGIGKTAHRTAMFFVIYVFGMSRSAYRAIMIASVYVCRIRRISAYPAYMGCVKDMIGFLRAHSANGTNMIGTERVDASFTAHRTHAAVI